VDGWLGAGRRNPRRVRAGERRSAAQIHITRVRALFHGVKDAGNLRDNLFLDLSSETLTL
jgi:hypothetical protein